VYNIFYFVFVYTLSFSVQFNPKVILKRNIEYNIFYFVFMYTLSFFVQFDPKLNNNIL